jgi:hypothetical protein
MRAIPTRSEDTSQDAERVQIELLRAAPVSRRLELAWSLSSTVIFLARRAIERAAPAADPLEHDVRFVELHYGSALAAGLREELLRRRQAASASR